MYLHHRTVDQAVDHDSTVAIADPVSDHECVDHVTIGVVGATDMGGVDLTEGAIVFRSLFPGGHEPLEAPLEVVEVLPGDGGIAGVALDADLIEDSAKTIVGGDPLTPIPLGGGVHLAVKSPEELLNLIGDLHHLHHPLGTGHELLGVGLLALGKLPAGEDLTGKVPEGLGLGGDGAGLGHPEVLLRLRPGGPGLGRTLPEEVGHDLDSTTTRLLALCGDVREEAGVPGVTEAGVLVGLGEGGDFVEIEHSSTFLTY